MPDTRSYMERLRMGTDEIRKKILEEYALERAQPLLNALEEIKKNGLSVHHELWTRDARIANAAISAWNERK